MKKIEKYQAYDGTKFVDQEKCESHEKMCTDVSLIMKRLPELPSGTDFSNGSGFIQHDINNFTKARIEILKIAWCYTDHKWIKQAIDNSEIDPSYSNRIMSECCPRVISKAWNRFMCTAKNFKEYGQPYFATHPCKAKQVCLNKEILEEK